MKIEMIECDNPECENVGRPENPNIGPYGWLQGNIVFIGYNIVNFDACSIGCVNAAILEKINHYSESDDE